MTLRKLLVVGTVLVAVSCSRNPETSTSAIPTAPQRQSPCPSREGAGVSHKDRRQLPATQRDAGLKGAARVQVCEQGAHARPDLRRHGRRGRLDPGIPPLPCQRMRSRYGDVQRAGTGRRRTAPRRCAPFDISRDGDLPPRENSVDFRRQLGAKYRGWVAARNRPLMPKAPGFGSRNTFAIAPAAAITQAPCRRRWHRLTAPRRPRPALSRAPTPSLRHQWPRLGWRRVQCGVGQDVRDVRVGGGERSAVGRVEAPITGGDRSRVSLLVAPNSGGPRSGTVRVNYPGGAVFFEVTQNGLSYNLELPVLRSRGLLESDDRVPDQDHQLGLHVDGGGHRAARVHCELRLAGGLHVWRDESRTQNGALPTYLLTESCAASSAGASVVPISVKLTVTDTLGNTATLYSGQGSQPALQLKTSPCP